MTFRQFGQRIAQIHLRHRPIERNPLAGRNTQNAAIPINRGSKDRIVAEFVALMVESRRLRVKVSDALRRMRLSLLDISVIPLMRW